MRCITLQQQNHRLTKFKPNLMTKNRRVNQPKRSSVGLKPEIWAKLWEISEEFPGQTPGGLGAACIEAVLKINSDGGKDVARIGRMLATIEKSKAANSSTESGEGSAAAAARA